MNKVILMGRLTRDPEIRYTQGDNSMCIARYTLAVDRRFGRNNDDGNNADFIPCVCFGKAGEFVEKYLKKGMKMAVTGRIQTGSYTNKDGVKVYTTEVVVEDQEFAESKNSGQGSYSGNGSYNNSGNNSYGNGGNNGYGTGNNQNSGGNRGYGNSNGNSYNGNNGQNGGNRGYGNNNGNSYNGNNGQNGGNRGYGNGGGNSYTNGGGYQQNSAPQGSYQQSELDGFMNIPDGIDEELPFA